MEEMAKKAQKTEGKKNAGFKTPSNKLPLAICCTDRQQATGNRQQATGNRQQATGNRSEMFFQPAPTPPVLRNLSFCAYRRYEKSADHYSPKNPK